MTVRKTYNCNEGETTVFASELVFVTLLRVERTDKVMNIVNDSDLIRVEITSNQVGYIRWAGGLTFSIPFNNGEKINVVYEN